MNHSENERRGPSSLIVLIVVGLIGAAVWWLVAGKAEPVATNSAEGEAGPGAAAQRTGSLDVPELAVPVVADLRASVAGTVRDEQGRAIAGAQVCAFAESPLLASADRREPKCTQTGKDGHYALTGLFGVRQSVVAGAPGFIAKNYQRGEGAKRRGFVELKPGAAVTGIDIVLLGGGVEIKGHVRDLSGGAVSGALVRAEEAVAYADAEGGFSLWVKPGSVDVRAYADGYTDGNDEGAAPGHVFEVFLTPEAVIVGRVIRAGDGSPVEGAKVQPMDGQGWSWGTDSLAYTDAGGNFRLDRLKPGAYKPKASADDAYGVAEEQVVLGMGETSEALVISAHPAFTIEGRIVSDEGDACDVGWVSLADKANDRETWQQAEPDGLVRVQGVLPGEHKVDVNCEGMVAAEKYDPVIVADASVAGIKWEVSQGLTIRGTVVDDAGKPVPDMNLQAQPRTKPGEARAQQTIGWNSETDDKGYFELAGLLPGEYEVSVSPWSTPRAVPAKPTTVTLAKGKDAEVKISLPATAELRGRVRDSNGRPVRKASVALTGGKQQLSAYAGDDGTFVIPHAPPGEYRAVAWQGWEAMRAPNTKADDVQGVKVTLVAGAREKVELVVEDMSGQISGVVRAEGGPVVDAFVEASRESDSASAASGEAAREVRWGSYFKAPEMTDQDGKFRLTGLAPGKYTLRAHRNGGGEAIREHVVVGTDVELAIALPGSLAGTVRVRGGDAPEEFRVNVEDEATGYRRGDSFFRTRGAWRLPELPQGKFKVTASAGEGSQEIQVELAAGEQRRGVQIELAPKVTVRGTVVDLEGKPVAGLQVMINGASFSGWNEEDKQNVTDEAGRYEVPRAPTGKIEVYVMPRSFGSVDDYGWTTWPTVLPEGKPVVDLPPIRVTKKRVPEDQVAGDLGYSLKHDEPGADPLARTLVVAVVRPGGPAAAAGLQVGDVITQVDGHDVSGAGASLHYSLTRVLEGTVVTLGLARGTSVQVTAGKKP